MGSDTGAVLRRLRKLGGYMQQDVVRLLGEMGIAVNKNHISRWENGYNSPNIEQFLGLCRIYSVTDPCRVFLDGDFSEPSSGLDKEGRAKLAEYRELLLSSGRYSPRADGVLPFSRRTLPVYDAGASAGTGQFLDSDSYEMTEVPDGVPESATFGLRVCGDSMEPTYSDGELVFVHMQPAVESGETGIFFLDGSVYIKELMLTPGGAYLRSVNPRYAPIPVKEYSDIKVYGKVVYPGR